MKKWRSLLLTLPIGIASCFVMAGCGEEPHTHTLDKVDAVVATCEINGNTEYYKCTDCDKFFSDANATTEIDEGSWKTSALGHTYTDDNDYDCNRCSHERETSIYNIWDGSTTPVSTNDATEYVISISTAEQLAGLAQAVNAGTTFEGYTIKLTCDINLAGIEWTPIGYGYARYQSGNQQTTTTGVQSSFDGEFDGQNHTIYNLKITTFNDGGREDASSAGVGLFGFSRGSIKNLTVDTAIVTGNHYVGVIVGYSGYTMATSNSFKYSNITNCKVKNAVVSCVYIDENESGDKAGAVVGTAYVCNVTNCVVENCSINADRDAGQVIGYLHGASTQTNNSASNVVVTANNTSSNTNSGSNINNTIVGRSDN